MAEAKDLLRGLSGDFGAVTAVFPAAAEDKPGEIELTLGLSIGGSFGGESKKGSLHRSSSISFLPSLQQRGKEESIAVTALARTSSLPVETEEEQRKRKELQYLRRMEAKRKRSEKRNCSRPSGRNRSAGREELQQAGGNKVRVSPESENPAASALGCGEGAGASSGGESAPARSPSPEKTETEVRGMMEEMPCVFTVGGEGKRVEGFLYRYRKGEEVRIVCVCHGRFFSPAEFVEHAGGGVVTHPLRHIVVNPSPAGFC